MAQRALVSVSRLFEIILSEIILSQVQQSLLEYFLGELERVGAQLLENFERFGQLTCGEVKP